MAIFNLRRVFLPTAVGIQQAYVALRKSRFMISSNFTFDNIFLFFRAMLITWVIAGYGGVKSVAAQEQLDESSIPKVPVEYAGEMGLELKRTVELVFDEAVPGIGRIGWIGITPDSSLLLTDRISRRAHEFSLNDGRYIRSFGRTGKGPGEYGSAGVMAMDSKGDVYVMDPTYGQLLHYNRQGQYLDDKMRWMGCRGLLISRDDALTVMDKRGGYIMQIQRITGLNGAVEYTIPLSSKTDQIISCRLRNSVQLCYNSAQDRLYYLEANDYMVKEIDASTGDILRQFGTLVPSYNVFTLEKQQPPDFKFLPREYHGLDCGSVDREAFFSIMSGINRATSMVLIGDRYLLISHTSPERMSWSPNEWTLYDLVSSASSELIEAYSLNGAAYQSLEGIKKDSKETVVKAGRIDGRIASWESQIYVYRPPQVEAADKSNGIVDIYVLSVKR